MDQYSIQTGETLRGTVQVDVNKAVRCNGLRVRLIWRVHGRGNRYTEIEDSLIVFQGDWSPGDQLTYPFSFRIPHRPLTWNGKLVNIDWYITAQADIPWAIDPKSSIDFTVSPGSTPPPKPDHIPDDGTSPIAAPFIAVIPIIFALVSFVGFAVWGGISILISVLAVYESTQSEDFNFIPVLVNVVFSSVCFTPFFIMPFLFGAFILYRSRQTLGNLLARKKVSELNLTATPRILRPGEAVDVRLSFEARKTITVESVTLSLIRIERATSGSGTNRTTYTDRQIFAEEVCIRNRVMAPGDPVATQATLQLPPDAVASLQVRDNQIMWFVLANIDMPGWVDRYEQQVLNVY